VSRQSGGANGIGAVYKLSHNPVGEWAEEVIYSFQQGTDGNSPISNLVFDAAGNLYGTTSEGGLGSGTIFKLSPVGAGKWTETVVHAFEGPPDGGFAYNGMMVDGGESLGAGTDLHEGVARERSARVGSFSIWEEVAMTVQRNRDDRSQIRRPPP
jgi:uncharacterized repeat protein (TIGR03803 family)